MRPASDAAPAGAGALLVAGAFVDGELVGDGRAGEALVAAAVGDGSDIGEEETVVRAPSAAVSAPCPVAALLAGSDEATRYPTTPTATRPAAAADTTGHRLPDRRCPTACLITFTLRSEGWPLDRSVSKCLRAAKRLPRASG